MCRPIREAATADRISFPTIWVWAWYAVYKLHKAELFLPTYLAYFLMERSKGSRPLIRWLNPPISRYPFRMIGQSNGP